MTVKVEVRLFAGFRDGRFKRQEWELPEGTRLREVVERLEIPADEVSLPLVNGHYSDLDRELKDGDLLSLFPAVAGG